MTHTADFVVIGGGIAGMSAAAELAQDGRVIVLEAEPHIGYHSTGRSAAIFVRNYGNATIKILNGMSFSALNGALLGESVLSPRGELLLAQDHEMGMLDAFLQENSGIDRLTPDEACAIVPVLRRDRIAGACLERDALDIDVDRLLQGMAGLVRGRGGRIETDQRVQGIVRQAGIWAVETATQRIEAPVIVNAAGAWADQIAAMAGAQTIGLQPLRRSAVKMAVPQSVSGSASWPLFASVAEDWYAKPEGGGLMISPADEDPISPQDAWPDDMVLAEGLHRFEQMVDLPIVRPSHSWAGLRSFVADRTPVAGFAPETEGFFWLAGQGGYGVQTSPAMAAVTRALCCHAGAGVEPDLLAMLSPARFLG